MTNAHPVRPGPRRTPCNSSPSTTSLLAPDVGTVIDELRAASGNATMRGFMSVAPAVVRVGTGP